MDNSYRRQKVPYGYVEITLAKDQDYGNCLDGYYISWAGTSKGWGPMLYDLAIEVATSQGGGLTADRGRVSLDAQAVWKYYDEKRLSDIESLQLDITLFNRSGIPHGRAQLTPDDSSDDCAQDPSIEWTKYNKGEWYDAPMSRIFRSKGGGTPMLKKLSDLKKIKGITI